MSDQVSGRLTSLQQGYLELDGRNYLVPLMMTETDNLGVATVRDNGRGQPRRWLPFGNPGQETGQPMGKLVRGQNTSQQVGLH